ncbi:MAG: hypothetical protein VYD64_00610 [Pseudomonadota bacterium]|nr:hypothetical protein [Pseudomonadota bacterium]
MSNIICFPDNRPPANSALRPGEPDGSSQGAEIVFFTGVRYSRQDAGREASHPAIGSGKKREA